MKLLYLLLFILLGLAVAGIIRDRSPIHGSDGQSTPEPVSSVSAQPNAVIAELVNRCSKSLAVVEGDQALGSASIIKIKGNPLVVTNIHVMSGNPNARVRLLNGRQLALQTLGLPEDRDIMVATQRDVTEGLVASTSVDSEVSIGDAVLVLGNSQGSNVVTQISGKVLGIGPDLIETDAKFVEGNSGSPIIHVKTGKVIAIATFATVRKLTALTRDSQFAQVRRFGYRLDTISQWRFLTPQSFSTESGEVAQVKQRTDELFTLAQELLKNGRDTPSLYDRDGWVRHYVELLGDGPTGEFGTKVGMIKYQKILAEFYDNFNTDLSEIAVDKLIPYHQHELKDEEESREVLARFFDKVDWSSVRFN